MFVELKLPTRLMPGLTIPIDAVVNSGTSERVFVERGEGKFEPREVKTGWHFGDRVQIVSGLMENERVVASGTFMVDSESRLKSVAAGANKASITDPVCGMDLAQETARASGTYSVHDGETFYFCSESCKRTFEKTPQKYSASRHRGQVAEVQDASDREHAR